MTDHDKPMSMVERVARALIADEYDGGHLSGAEIEACIAEDWCLESRRKHFIRKARAAIEAMREPTEAMVKSGQTKCDDYLDAAECWAAMIDAALSEHQQTQTRKG